MKKMLFRVAYCLILSTVLFSCKSSPDKMIVGTWSLLGPDMKKSDELKIMFKENKVAVAMSPGMESGSRDSVKYEISKDGKKLTTTENSGRVESMQILELGEKNMMLVSVDGKDTLRLVRE